MNDPADDDPAPVPWRLGVECCGAITFTGFAGKPEQCAGAVRWAGVLLVERVGHAVSLWPAFACDTHRGEIDAPRELLDRDHARRRAWSESRMRQMQGLRTERPGPLAHGAAARERHRRALALAEAPEPSTPD